MSEQGARKSEETPVDDVRRVRERLSREAGGNVREMIRRSNEAFDALQRRLKLSKRQKHHVTKARRTTKKFNDR
jgi:hypothetical protein